MLTRSEHTLQVRFKQKYKNRTERLQLLYFYNYKLLHTIISSTRTVSAQELFQDWEKSCYNNNHMLLLLLLKPTEKTMTSTVFNILLVAGVLLPVWYKYFSFEKRPQQCVQFISSQTTTSMPQGLTVLATAALKATSRPCWTKKTAHTAAKH